MNPEYNALYGFQKFLGESAYSFGYIHGYKVAGDTLVDENIPDLFLFPTIFIYRQYLELILKNICHNNMPQEEYTSYIRIASHNLLNTWSEAKKFLKVVESDNINYIDSIVNLFHSLDNNSMRFRYEFDKMGQRMLPEDMCINLLEVKNMIDKVDEILFYTYGVI
jgi:hypothetical protein